MTTITWDDDLSAIREGKQTIPTAQNGLPVVAVNAPVYELMQLMEAMTTGYNNLVARDGEHKRRIERIRNLARASFPAEHYSPADGWVSVNDMLPPKSDYYICWNADCPTIPPYSYPYSAKHSLFNALDHTSLKQAQETDVRVTHWCPLQKPPVVAKKEGDR